MICPNCGSKEGKIILNLSVEIPFDKERRITKKFMQSKNFKLLAAKWDTATCICNKCNYRERGILD